MIDDETPYQIVTQGDRYVIQDSDAKPILESRDERNAQHYLALLKKAYSVGYKAGYRAGKKSVQKSVLGSIPA